jgi:hypothetical protein
LFLGNIFAVPVKTPSPIPNSVKEAQVASKLMPQKKYKNFSPSLIFFRLPVIYPLRVFLSKPLPKRLPYKYLIK